MGLPLMGLGLGGVVIGRAGGDPDEALNAYAFPLFALGFAVLFSMRLIFWQPVTPIFRRLVRLIISMILAANIPLSLLSLVLASQLPSTVQHTDMPIGASILAVLCQPLSALWLFRYRQEGL